MLSVVTKRGLFDVFLEVDLIEIVFELFESTVFGLDGFEEEGFEFFFLLVLLVEEVT